MNYQPGYQTAANPYSSSAFMGLGPGSQGYSSHPSYSGYGNYASYGSPFGLGYGSMTGDQMWQGFFGQTAESLGRLNNLLSMTGMLVDHMSNHGKLLYTKGTELHNWYKSVKSWAERHSEWMERLGLQLESGWRTSEDEEKRRRRMLVRRARTMILVSLLVLVFYLMRKSRKRTRQERWESIFQYSSPRFSP